MSVFVNRVLNLKKIKAIGLDMDYTIVRYNSEEFEGYAYEQTKKLLIKELDYPKEILELDFIYQLVIQGLVIDRKRGNLLKLSRFGKVKSSRHGTKELPFKQQQKLYSNLTIELSKENFQSLDTLFSVSNGVLFSQLVDLKESGVKLPDFYQISLDIKAMLDLIHNDGSLKMEIRKNPEKYIIKDPNAVEILERMKLDGKKLLIITNSEFPYCKFLMEYAIDPFLKHNKNWMDLFEIVITLSRKPNFFYRPGSFMAIDPGTGLMTNWFSDVTNGIYQGGWAKGLQESLKLEGEEILYIGDHIYGDVVSLKKNCNWRTALVFEPLEEEISGLQKGQKQQDEIDLLMLEKEQIEKSVNQTIENLNNEKQFQRLDQINTKISKLINKYNENFNPYWGQMMRAGSEESRLADQIEKYACIYMTQISDLLKHTTKTYFRPLRRTLPHERTTN